MLIQDPFGNYIIQILLELKQCQIIVDKIIEIVKANIYYLSLQKVSSNVVERCIELSSSVIFLCRVKELKSFRLYFPAIKLYPYTKTSFQNML